MDLSTYFYIKIVLGEYRITRKPLYFLEKTQYNLSSIQVTLDFTLPFSGKLQAVN